MEEDKTSEDTFYSDSKKYWENIPATVDGMLGGFSHISITDISGSTKFLRPFIKGPRATAGTSRALDCGAGIGRVTKLLLMPYFDQVDMVEVNAGFLAQTRDYVGERFASRLGEQFCTGLQDFEPQEGRYDVIWVQWVVGYLTDDDLVAFFRRCRRGLRKGGVIIVKDNVCSGETSDFDKNDSSYTRPKRQLMEQMERAELTLLRQQKQTHFPREIYEVWMFALQ